MSINSVANPSVLDLMNRHGLQQVGQMNAANTNTHIAIIHGQHGKHGKNRSMSTLITFLGKGQAQKNVRRRT